MKGRRWGIFFITAIIVTGLADGCGKNTEVSTVSVDEQKITDQSINEESENNIEEDHDKTVNVANEIVELDKEVAGHKDVEEKIKNAVATQNVKAFSFTDLTDHEFEFSSGVGGWATVFNVDTDGSFKGSYHDSDMGDVGEGYPNGTFYFCSFSGRFTKPKKINDYTYSVKIASMKYDDQVGTEEFADGMKYVYTEPYGLEDADEILIYLPGSPISKLPEPYMEWVRNAIINENETVLPFYGLYNKKLEYGFSSILVEKTAIDIELEEIEKQAEAIMADFETMSQQGMNSACYEVYALWDDELNSIWSRLKEKLDKETMDQLTVEEREWIKYKEAEVKKAGADWEGGSMQPMIEYDMAGMLTRERVYILAAYLR